MLEKTLNLYEHTAIVMRMRFIALQNFFFSCKTQKRIIYMPLELLLNSNSNKILGNGIYVTQLNRIDGIKLLLLILDIIFAGFLIKFCKFH